MCLYVYSLLVFSNVCSYRKEQETEPNRPNRTEPNRPILEPDGTGRRTDPNRTGPSHDASENTGRTASNREHFSSEPSQTEPIIVQKSPEPKQIEPNWSGSPNQNETICFQKLGKGLRAEGSWGLSAWAPEDRSWPQDPYY